ncbi:hypothetical protein HKX42_03830 [Salinisphaera sp. USBA-960]|nr:hypothetical protein [Salifodinibacter halophilus]NNC26007.1 hypothetical protein [Salifodinibacter halophilus]
MVQTKDQAQRRPVSVREGFHRGTRVVFVPLTQGHEVIVEPADWHRVAEHYGTRWTANVTQGHIYARKAARHPDGTIRMTSLARVILDAGPDERVTTDNGNALDLRRSNLTKRRFGGEVAKRRREQHHARQHPEQADTPTTP